jgi:hypothetical protein
MAGNPSRCYTEERVKELVFCHGLLMKEFRSISVDVKACKMQLRKFRKFLEEANLREAEDIRPFFRKNEDLTAFMAGRFPELIQQDRIAFEFELFGDFACDVVIGNSKTASYCFVEFEEGKARSIFRKSPSKATPDWSPGFERGFSQIVDWFWKLDEMRSTPAYSDRFGATQLNVYGLLVVGRGQGLESREQRRLNWRLKKVLMDSHQLHCITYDQLYTEMSHRLLETGA